MKIYAERDLYFQSSLVSPNYEGKKSSLGESKCSR